ncbi:hypothetical protein E4U43_000853 [Claviceps pusilla]|uniref:EKC/KEOPS complex subunit GON7 n=1 Tax=Claviceps pusilla TaxID=123648 RepID=A0A9P7N9A7_9HYPO|nr:hypothetical protein E4U43_000853 [Claviceps pusilla]
MSPENNKSSLTAAYTSPDNKTFTLTKPLDHLPASPSTQDKTTYLRALRDAVSETQQQINKELTARMEEDSARGSAAGQQARSLSADEHREEENYGEEVQGED